MTPEADKALWRECPCCDEAAVPPSSLATEDDATEDVGDPLWTEGDEARCACGCLVRVVIDGDGVAWSRASCVDGDKEAWAACPCKRCRAVWREERGAHDA